MKRFAAVLTTLVMILSLGAVPAMAQTYKTPTNNSSFAVGVYYGHNFGVWSIPLASANTGTGSQTYTVQSSTATTHDGILFTPWVVKNRVAVGSGSVREIVAITAVSGCSQGATACTFTASFSNAHVAGERVVSADDGSVEALNFAANTGGGMVRFNIDCGPITLSTSSVTTTTTCYVPNLFFNQGSASRVTTTITTSTGWEVGVTGALATFSTNNTTLTAGTTAFTVQGTPAVALVTSATAMDLAAIIITAAGGAAGAGAIHTHVWGLAPAMAAF